MKALLFGSIGTVIETSEIQRQAFNLAFREHGLDWVWEREAYAALLKASGGANRIADFATTRGESVDAAAVHQTKSRLFLEMLSHDSLDCRPGVSDVLKLAQARHLKTGIVSTTEQATISAITEKLARAGVPAFDVVTSRGLGLADKPAPDAYLHAIRTLSISPNEALVIENNLAGVRAAKAAGLSVLAFPGAFDDPDNYSREDVQVVEELFDTVKAWMESEGRAA
ncbi:MAG: HAD-IA family hydrolase [Pseudomonadota bacterium]